MKPTNIFHPLNAWRPRAAATGLMASVVLGAMLATASYADMYRPATNAVGGVPVTTTFSGGVPAQSFITSQTSVGSNSTVCWYGMQGWYTVEMSTNANGPTWTGVGRTAASGQAWCLTVTNGGINPAFFRLNQLNAFAGSGACSGCHGGKYSEYLETKHASAFSAITNEVTQASELVYRTVGYGQPSGFVNSNTTPQLANVGCESCHGPAAWHKYSDHDLIRPAVSIDPEICGGCHNTTDRPTYGEYVTTLHSAQNNDIRYGVAGEGVYYPGTISIRNGTNWVAPGTAGSSNAIGYFVITNVSPLKTNFTTGIIHSGNGTTNYLYDPGQDRAASCGICHSAATRMAMIGDYEARLAGRTNALAMPVAADAAAWTATCATCHDPHSDENPGQLRYPLWSTNYFTQPTTTDKRTVYSTNFLGAVTTNVIFMNTPFAANYDPSIQVCGQCHNSRGARWDGRSYGFITNGATFTFGLTTNVSISRPPHHSPQYNILSGNIQPDYLTGVYGTNFVGCHTLNTNGCAACHVHSEESPISTGHTFEPEMAGCSVAGCHDGTTVTGYAQNPTNGLEVLQAEIGTGITNLVSNLNDWAIYRGRALYGASSYSNYLQNGWEYTTPGELVPLPAKSAPSSTEQLLIPPNILQARFNLYMLNYGRSLGIHNPQYSRYLLADASNKVYAVTYPLPTAPAANFSASTKVAKNTKVIFSNKSEYGLTSFDWDFGDGHTFTGIAGINPTNTYTSAGTYTVSLIGHGGGVPDNMKSNYNYITVVEPPGAVFTAGTTAGLAPLAVTFTNLSTNATAYVWTFGDGKTSTNGTATVSNTYSNAGTYTVKLQAGDKTVFGGTNIVTNVNYIVVSAPPAASFTGTPTSGLVPLTVVFTNMSANATAYVWDFGDGNTSTATSTQVTNTYASGGNYTVTLKAINLGVTNTLTRASYINAIGTPVANFVGGPTAGIGMHPMTVTFTNLSLNATAYVWDFGDGGTSTSTAATLTHQYLNVGTNTVSLQAINLGVTNTLVRTNYVFLTP